jgi:S-adenosylmethionine hydrolase
LRPYAFKDGEFEARIIHIDHFGNCVTNITRNELTPEMIAAGAKLRLRGKSVQNFRSYFSEETEASNKLFGIWGSAGFLEVAASSKSAAALIKAKVGDPVILLKE